MPTRTPRWIRPMLADAALRDVPLPWERGPGRAARIARRNGAD